MTTPDRSFFVTKVRTGYVVATRPGIGALGITFDTTHDVAAAALLCGAVVITDDINVRHACRAIRVRTLWPEEVTR